MATAVIYAFEYLLGLPIFGLIYWLLNGILVDLRIMSVSNTTYQYANYMWGASLIIYLVFGIFYFLRRLRTWNIMR